MTVKIKLIYLICMILCVFLTFSTVSAADLNEESIYDSISDSILDSSINSAVEKSQSESSLTNLNQNRDPIEYDNEDKDCVDSMNELSNLNLDKSDLNSINSDEKSLKSGLNNIYSNSADKNSSVSSDDSLKANPLKANSYAFSDLQSLIDSSPESSVVNLDGRTFIGNGTPIYINKPITINGGSNDNMATLDSRKLTSIIIIRSNNVHLLNCNFINGIYISVNIIGNDSSVSNCNFRNNYKHLIVDNSSENFYLENSNFSFANSDRSSSVILLAKNVTVKNSNFFNNTIVNNTGLLGHGGALQVGGKVNGTNIGYVINCTFINNTVITIDKDTHAGALCFRPGIKVINSTFINNYCNKVGGATSLHSDGELINCIFINNTAGEYGGAISTGLLTDDISVNITGCVFINNSAPMGGAIQIKGHNVKVTNSIFEGNEANETDGGAIFIVGNNALIINSTFNSNYAKNFGAGIFINGSDASILNSSFEKNFADYGAAVYVFGANANLFSSNFTNHIIKNGSVYIEGINTYVYESIFKNNTGESGAGLYIKGSNANLILSNFSRNDVGQKGGAIFIDGSNAKLILSNFLNNNAIPNADELDSGLGGAIYIKGDNNTIDSSIFNFNTARNGSAIYSDGLDMTLSNTSFDKNQAWSYSLESSVNPAISYFNESDILINLTLVGGNNIANSIYNTASMDEIYFYNVSYMSSKGKKTTSENEVHPVNGAQNSNEGSLLYQDDREDNQIVNVIIYKDSQNNDSSLYPNDADNDITNPYGTLGEIVFNQTFKTGILGDIHINLSDYFNQPLEAGKYLIYANHFEDDYYKGIDEENKFDIIPIVDLSVNIASSRVNMDLNKTVKYTIKVNNNGPNNASGVNLSAAIPEGLVYLSATPSIGTYTPEEGIWVIGNLDIGENQTLIINALTDKTGLIDFPVNVSSIEDDSNLSNNFKNKTIKVLSADLNIDIEASQEEINYGDTINWTVIIRNDGPDDASKLVVSFGQLGEDLIYLNCSNDNFNQTSLKLDIPSLVVGEEIGFVISTKVNSSNKKIILPTNVTADTYDPNESNNLDWDSAKVAPLCDLITKVSVSPNPANIDDIVDWIVVVSNEGPDDASDVVVSLFDLESLGAIFINSSDESFDKDNLVWHIGDLAKGENKSLTITTQIDGSNKTITLEGNASCDTFEADYENNFDKDSLVVEPLCDLLVTIVPDKDPTSVGETVNWIINITNVGPDNASDVNVVNELPEGLEYLIHESSKGELVNVTDENGDIVDLTWKVGELANNESAYLIVSTKTLEEGIVLNNASANSSTKDIDESNNFDSSEIEVLPLNNDDNEDNNGENPDSNESKDDFDEDYDDNYDYPWDDYNLFNYDGNNNSGDNSKKDDSSNNKSLCSPLKKITNPIDISSKKTGNPLALVVFSLLTLFLVKVRKN